MNFQAHPRIYYEKLYHDYKYNGASVEYLNCQESMEFSYYNIQLAADDLFPLNCIVMTKEWYIKWCTELGKNQLMFNDLKIFIDETLLPSYAFMYREK